MQFFWGSFLMNVLVGVRFNLSIKSTLNFWKKLKHVLLRFFWEFSETLTHVEVEVSRNFCLGLNAIFLEKKRIVHSSNDVGMHVSELINTERIRFFWIDIPC